MKVSTIFRAFLALAILATFSTSCSNDQDLNPEAGLEINETIKSQFLDLGFDPSDIAITGDDREYLDQDYESQNYLLEGDINITPDNFQEMLQSEIFRVGAVGEQYRTSNLVSVGSSRTIRVIGYTGGGGFGLTSKMRTALQWAINNYNRIGIRLNFTLTFGTNFQPFDIVVYRVSGGGGGSAGFPSGGDPYKFVQIQSGTDNFDTNVVEHVMTHEIGHCLGLRHTDFFDRSFSCGGSPVNEGSGGVGAINIPGTPTGIDPESVMLACFSSSEDGEFGGFDVTALSELY